MYHYMKYSIILYIVYFVYFMRIIQLGFVLYSSRCPFLGKEWVNRCLRLI
jgi:hypothetical protein